MRTHVRASTAEAGPRVGAQIAQAFGDPDLWAIRSSYDGVLAELDELAEAWIEWRAAGRDTRQLATAIDQAIRESRTYERKLRKAGAL